MDHRKVTRDQAKLILDRIAPTEQYLRALSNRMDQLQFPRDDSLRILANRAVESLRDLRSLLSNPSLPQKANKDLYDVNGPNPLF